MEPFVVAALMAASVAAGAMNAVAGGGSFLTFPALIFAGVPPISANATSAAALWPASVASAAAYREDLAHERRVLVLFGVVSLVGGLLGALLLLLTPERAFARLVPWLLLVATVIFALGPRITRALRARHIHASVGAILAVQFVVGVYGGYFGGGIGILMLAALSALGMENIHAMNGLKAILAVGINGVAVATFVVAGIITWSVAPLMILAGVAGGWFGARLARRAHPGHVRGFVIGIGAVLTAYFFLNP